MQKALGFKGPRARHAPPWKRQKHSNDQAFHDFLPFSLCCFLFFPAFPQICTAQGNVQARFLSLFQQCLDRKWAVYCFKSTASQKNSLSSTANSVSSAKNSVSSLWRTNNRLRETHWVLSPELAEGQKTHCARCLKPYSPKPYSACFRLEAKMPTPNPEIPPNTHAPHTRTVSRSSHELFTASLWHESEGQQKLFRRTCSDELFILGGFVGVWIPPPPRGGNGRITDYCFESAVSEERTHWVLWQRHWVLRKKSASSLWHTTTIGWDELTEWWGSQNTHRVRCLQPCSPKPW